MTCILLCVTPQCKQILNNCYYNGLHCVWDYRTVSTNNVKTVLRCTKSVHRRGRELDGKAELKLAQNLAISSCARENTSKQRMSNLMLLLQIICQTKETRKLKKKYQKSSVKTIFFFLVLIPVFYPPPSILPLLTVRHHWTSAGGRRHSKWQYCIVMVAFLALPILCLNITTEYYVWPFFS